MTHPQLRRLKIHRYEQFVDVPWIEFSPHENLILGINGAGKTSLLKLIHAVLTFDYRKLLAQDFDVEFELAYPASSPLQGTVEVSGRVLRTAQVLTDEALRHPESMDDLNQLEADMEARSGAHRLNFTVLREQATLALDGRDVPVSRKPPRGRVLPWEDARVGGGPTMLALLPSFSGFFVRESDDDFRALVDDVEFSLAPDSAKRFGIEDARDVPPMLLLALLRHLADLKEEKKIGMRFGRDDLLPDVLTGTRANSFQRL
ncbi:MAG TPA: AAA family ATPase, partial [Nannocystis sp.]